MGVPGVTVQCRQLLMLQLPATGLAWGPLRTSDLAKRFVRLAFELIDQISSRRNCTKADHLEVNHPEENALQDVEYGMATGQLASQRARDRFAGAATHFAGRRPDGHFIWTNRVYWILRTQWARTGKVQCPEDQAWEEVK